jgi:hypothetical protein
VAFRLTYLLSAFWAGWRYSSDPTQPRRRDPRPSARDRQRHREPFVGTIRREQLDDPLIINRRHAATELREYELYDNNHRPHRSLGQAAPLRPLPDRTTPGSSCPSTPCGDPEVRLSL